MQYINESTAQSLGFAETPNTVPYSMLVAKTQFSFKANGHNDTESGITWYSIVVEHS